MGILRKLFGGSASIQQLPAGTITVDRLGNIVTSTVSSSFPRALLQAIANEVLDLFQEARQGQAPLSEVSLHFVSLRITAREMRGGAVIFMFPQLATTTTLRP